jgi:vitamin B12 transporter
MKNVLLVIIFLAGLLNLAYAEDVDLERIVVTPSRMEEESHKYGGSIISIKDALKEIGTLDIVQTGGFGQQTSIFMRGANSNHTLFMLDGVKFYDPMSPNGAPDIAHLTLDNLERIEVVEGTKSSLYGSDAIGGVINMITKKGRGKPSLSIINEAGSFYTHKHTIATQGELGLFGFSSSTSYFRTKGISAAQAKDNNPEKDRYDNLTTVNRFDYKISDSLALGTILRYTQARSEYDDSGGIGGDDPNKQQFFRQSIGAVFADYSLTDWNKQKLQVSWMHNFRRHRDDDNESGTTDIERAWYDGTNYQINWQNVMELADFETVICGFDWNREKGDSYYISDGVWGPYESDGPKRRTYTRGYYLENKLKIKDRIFLNSGFRIDDHSVFGSYNTYSHELIMKPIAGTKFWGSYGTGFKSPTLYQLYDPSNGNIELNPEESSSYEAGFEQKLFSEKISAGFLYFNNHFKNLIDWRSTGLWTGQYFNVSKARTYGTEIYLTLKPIDELKLNIKYLWLDTENKEDHSELLRRAKNKVSISADYSWQKIIFNLSVSYVGHRPDVSGTLLKSYVLMNSALSYDINKNTNWFMRMENMLDDNYEEVSGYGTPGFSVYSGIKLSF